MKYSLKWIFTNGHAWSNQFESYDDAINYIYLCDMIKNGSIDRVYIESTNEIEWIKEKAAQ